MDISVSTDQQENTKSDTTGQIDTTIALVRQKQIDDLHSQIGAIEKTKTQRQMENNTLLSELKRIVDETSERIKLICSKDAELCEQENVTLFIAQAKLNDLLGTSTPVMISHPELTAIRSTSPTSLTSTVSTSKSRLRDEDEDDTDSKFDSRPDPRLNPGFDRFNTRDHRSDHKSDSRDHRSDRLTKKSTQFSIGEIRKMQIKTLITINNALLNAYRNDANNALDGRWHPTFAFDLYPQFKEIEDVYRTVLQFLRPCETSEERTKRTSHLVSASIRLQAIISKHNAHSKSQFLLHHALALDAKYFPSKYVRDSWWHTYHYAFVTRLLPLPPYDEHCDFEVITTHGLLTCQTVKMDSV